MDPATSGTYTIRPYASNARDLKGVKLLQSTDAATGRKTWYYLEYRQGIGFDTAFGGNSNLTNGVLVHLGTDSNGNTSYLLDMTPATSSGAIRTEASLPKPVLTP